jgi:hypothetical protein
MVNVGAPPEPVSVGALSTPSPVHPDGSIPCGRRPERHSLPW